MDDADACDPGGGEGRSDRKRRDRASARGHEAAPPPLARRADRVPVPARPRGRAPRGSAPRPRVLSAVTRRYALNALPRASIRFAPEDLGELGGRRDFQLVVAAIRRPLVRPPAPE